MSLEEKLKEIDEICIKLENADLGLDEGVALYEKGTKIAKECLKELNEVKGKVNVIKKEIDSYKEEDFD
ncbi:MAG: exodeoxyribonuclease VII small subunit [Clostridia bacterium]|nr:exodeoxyribonuclease VII small subunit [Clostridia bacterium]